MRDDEQIDNVDRTRYDSIDQATGQHTASALGTPTCGPPGTGTKSCHPNCYEYELTQEHDLAGNVIATWGKETRGSDAFSADPIPTETRSFYDAADRLTYFNRHVNFVTPGEAGGVFEEYRYDALGRRVLVRSRRPSTCSSPCEAYVARTVWDGDQLLYEIRSSGQTGVNPVHMELEGGAQTGEDVNLFGIVVYAHAEGIDQPVGVLKQGASSVGGSGTWNYLTPHANYQGVWSYGTDASGSNCISVGANCPAWPGYAVTVDGQPQGADVATYTVWWGEILRGATTTGGPQYLRNRYYDAGTGRFTQLDPIGLAGGMNLYGFAEGDPVNFSDPMGLCPLCVAYVAFEIGATGYDLYDLAKTANAFRAGRATKSEFAVTAAGVGAGLLSFGGGYGRAGRELVSRLMKDAAENPTNWRVVGSFTEPALNKKAKGGISIQTVIENNAGDQLVRHTVRDRAGKVIDDHYRPLYKARSVDQR